MRRDTVLAIGVLILILAGLAAKSVLLSVPPVRTAPREFNALRAKARLAYILGDERPHPADSEGDDLVRGRLVTVLQQMGLKPVVRDQFACNDFQKARLVACARVRNVIAVMGPPTGKALLLSAHYDSVPVGPGASDDGIGVATLLEVGSLLKDRPLNRPIILLFNEGEELGLIGARAFLADPLSRNVDSLLNFEARGVNGPATMFETSQPNGAAIATYAASVRRPYASSLSTDVARLIPNDTDVTTYKERGWLTLNSAIVGNETRYHSSGDNLAGLDPRSLQDMGDGALALASKLSAGTPRPGGTRIFFDLSQRIFIQIPLWAGVVGLLVLLISFAVVSWRRGVPSRGAAAIFGAIVSASVLGWLAVTIAGVLRAGVYWRAHPEITFAAVYATALLGEVAILRTLGAKLEVRQLRPAYWLVFVILGGALALPAPGAIIYFLIPPAAVLLGVALRRWYAPAELIGGLVGILLLYLTWGELLAALEELFSPGPLWIVAPVAAIITAPVLIEAQPLFVGAGRRVTLMASASIALFAWVVVAATPAYSQDHQQRFTIEHLTEFPSGASSWSILNDEARLPAAYSSFGPWRLGKLDFSERQRWLAKAPAFPAASPPKLQVLEALNHGSERNIRLRLHANGAERILLVAPAEAHIRTAGIDGFVRPIASADSSGRFTISCTGRSCEGAELSIDLDSAKPVTFTVVGARNGLPPSAAPLMRARPQFARPQYTPDETVTVAHVKL
jgi:Peptidase family M28